MKKEIRTRIEIPEKIKTRYEIPVKTISVDIPIALYKQLHVVIINKYDSVYGHIREAFIEGLKMWLKKQERIAKKAV